MRVGEGVSVCVELGADVIVNTGVNVEAGGALVGVAEDWISMT